MNKRTIPKVIYVIAALTALTILRAQTLLFFPTLEMNGGVNPDAWLAPWVSDSILGLLVPVVIYFLFKGSGSKIWALLVMYSALGSFDYANGLATQWSYPLSTEIASSEFVFGSLISTLVFQLISTVLLFRSEVINYFLEQDSQIIDS
ncbi:MAG: hypothetical protein AAGA80_17670 [Cyanobacteria bacterium P01_F01_bin.143]